MKTFSLKQTLFTLALPLAAFASACGTSNDKTVGDDRQGNSRFSGGQSQAANTSTPTDATLTLSDASNSFCPTGYMLDSKYWLCTKGGRALGPFPPAMVNACIAAKGGEAVCRSVDWNADFARSLRGTGECMPGSKLDSTVNECIMGQDAYGPFSKALVDFCKKNVAAPASCETMRMNRRFVDSFAKKVPGNHRLAVPYFFQYNNVYQPGSTCNLTSIAMVAQYYGKYATPDYLYELVGSPVYTANDFVWVAAKLGLRGTINWNASRSQIKGHIDAGRPVIVQGWFTPPGHVMVITGYDSTGFFLNDPAGAWNGYRYGSYNKSQGVGKGIHYNYTTFETATTEPGAPGEYLITVLTP